jgi:hypothetical protein
MSLRRSAGARRVDGDVGQQVAADGVGGVDEVVEPAQVAGVWEDLEVRVGERVEELLRDRGVAAGVVVAHR